MLLLGSMAAALWSAAAEPPASLETTAVEPVSPLVKEPFYAVLIELAAGDSLGVWNGDELARRVTATGRSSHFPLDWIQRIERRPARPAEMQLHRGTEVRRMWRIELKETVDRPLPYSIFGYHPGSLRVSRELIVSEWAVGDLNLHYMQDDKAVLTVVSDVRVMRLDRGWIVLDIDGVIDHLLGEKLDDSWTLALAVAWDDEQPLTLAVSVGRNGRRIFGEIDLREDEVIAAGRPLGAALSRAARRWTLPPPDGGQEIWLEK